MNKYNAKDYLPLVQALADGKIIQYKYLRANGSDDWLDIEGGVDFTVTADRYRIKPEPREIWVNEWAPVGSVMFESESEALAHSKRYGIGHVTRRYREVIE